jgi:tRNA(fMet)-specific endonuclease VapC
MYILDTDHISVFDRGGKFAQILLSKLAIVDPSQVVTTIVTYEEQMRGWLSYTARSRSIQEQIAAYKRLERQLANYQKMSVISFDERSACSQYQWMIGNPTTLENSLPLRVTIVP